MPGKRSVDMVFLSKNILTRKRSFGFRKGEVIPGTPFHWQEELSPRDCSARWTVSSAGGRHPYICELIDPEDDELQVALCSNALAASGMTRHDGLANILAAGWLKDGVYYQVIELAPDEQPLASFKPAKPMDEESFLHVAQTLVDALVHLHKNNLVHSVISPEALRVAADGMRIADFWWSRSCAGAYFDDALESHFPGALSNMSLLCLAPELVAGAKPFRECDLFSLGATLFYLLTGEFPRKLDLAEDSSIGLKQLSDAGMKDLRDLRPGLKPQIYDAIKFCLQLDDVARENIFLVRDLFKDAAGKMAVREED